jgi:hypothetical protein
MLTYWKSNTPLFIDSIPGTNMDTKLYTVVNPIQQLEY